MLKFYERREQVVKPGLARLSAIGSAKLTPFLTNDTSLCITAARVARVYTARVRMQRPFRKLYHAPTIHVATNFYAAMCRP